MKRASGLTVVSVYARPLGAGREGFVTFQNDKDGRALFTVEVGHCGAGQAPFPAGGDGRRLRLGELVDGRDRWWDLRPPLPADAGERERLLGTLPPEAALAVALARVAGDDLEAAGWELVRDELVRLQPEPAFCAAVEAAAADAVGLLAVHAAPWLERVARGEEA